MILETLNNETNLFALQELKFSSFHLVVKWVNEGVEIPQELMRWGLRRAFAVLKPYTLRQTARCRRAPRSSGLGGMKSEGKWGICVM